MAKPILIVRFPELSNNTKNEFSYIHRYISEKVPDYNVLCIIEANIKTPVFEVFYEKDFKQAEYEELKKMILDAIEKS